MNLSVPRIIAATMLTLLAVTKVNGQPHFHTYVSVECIVLNSDRVVVGTIVGVERSGDDHKVTLSVEETLRGGHEERRVARLENFRPRAIDFEAYTRLKGFNKERLRVLATIVEEPRATIVGLVELSAKELKVWKADLTTLSKPEDIIRIARDTLRRAPGVTRISNFLLTVPLAGGYYGFGGNTRVEVPVDEHLEKKALQYLSSKALWQRSEGISALGEFKSEENIARVKALLNDPGWQEGEEKGLKVRYFHARAAAYRTLTYWGVKVARPSFQEIAPKDNP